MSEPPPKRARWVDFHCHLDLYSDHAQLIAECDRERVATLAVTTTPKAWKRNRELASDAVPRAGRAGTSSAACRRARGGDWPLRELLPDARYVGEVGLDASPRFYGSFDAQERVFERILRMCAEQGNKILTVHSVRAVSKVLQHLERALPTDRGHVVLHWFTGSAAEARRAVDRGYYFSVNSEMLKSPKLRTGGAVADDALTETDGPFVLLEGVPVRPLAVADTVAQLATVRGVNTRMETQILANLSTLVSQ